ncbi:MAG: hypothetical protein PHT91_01045 [Candidatus Nanoarchaeia archaeon]|nr:hypothetical protein [Candidatus Nanoarchaeia archaeon]
MQKEEVLKKLKERNDIKEISNGDYINFFKRIGHNKSVTKVMNFKPDYFITYFDNSFDCLFFIKNAFEAFSHLAKLQVLKSLNCELDFKSIIFYAKNSKLLKSTEMGFFAEKKSVDALGAFDKVSGLILEFEKKTGKKINLNIY